MMQRLLASLLLLSGCMQPTSEEWLAAAQERLFQGSEEEQLLDLNGSLFPSQDPLIEEEGVWRLTAFHEPTLRLFDCLDPTGLRLLPLFQSHVLPTTLSCELVATSREELETQFLSLIRSSSISSDSSKQVVSTVVRLRHIPISILQEALPEATQQAGLTEQVSNLSVGFAPENNLLFLRGPSTLVSALSRWAYEMDRPTQTVVMDCVFFQRKFENSLGNLPPGALPSGALYPSFAQGATSVLLNHTTPPVSTNPFGQIFLSLFQVNESPQNASLGFQLLVSRFSSLIMARPQVIVLSGSEAKLKMGNTGYTLFAQSDGVTTSISTEPIDSGLILRITPTVLADRSIQFKIYARNSSFTAQEAVLAANQNVAELATTIVTCRPHEAIRLGGIRLRKHSYQQQGTAFLRKIPLLNWIFSGFLEDIEMQEIDILLFPRLQSPSLTHDGTPSDLILRSLVDTPETSFL